MRAQAALEFMTFFGFFALLFLLISMTIFESQMVQIENKRWDVLKETGLSLRDEINTAADMGDGYWRYVELRGYDLSYEIMIKGSSITVVSDEGDIEFPAFLSTDKVLGEITLYSDGGKVLIKNNKGMIEIAQ